MVRLLNFLPLGLAAGSAIPTKEIVPGVHMPYASIGTWVAGSTTEKEDPTDIVNSWLELGNVGIDTALIYFDQQKIGEALAASGLKRTDLFITSKIPICEPLTARWAVESDLNRLNVSYIDLMLIHAPIGLPGACPRTWKVLEKLVAEGKLRAIGVSNFNKEQMSRIMKSATIPIAVNQIEYNPFVHDEETILFCHANNVSVEAWSPLNGGHGGKSVFSDPTVTSIATAHNVSAAQVALRWIVQRGDLVTVLSGNREHQANDADLWSFTLSDDEIDTMTKLHEAKTDVTV